MAKQPKKEQSSSDGGTVMNVVVWRGFTEVVKALIAAGADVNEEGAVRANDASMTFR